MPGREGFPIDYDHYVVLTGFSGDIFYYNDPIAAGGSGRDVPLSSSALLRAWSSSDEPLTALALAQ
jgi:hypothetical protein